MALVILTVAGWYVGDVQNLPLGATADVDVPRLSFTKLRKVSKEKRKIFSRCMWQQPTTTSLKQQPLP